jgi:hypothetical protein
MKDDKPVIFVCSCNSTEHQIVLHPHEDQISREVFVHIHLVRKSFWYRLKYGLKYIFGYKCRFGAWDEFILERKHVKGLEELTDFLKNQPDEKI